MYQFGNFSLDTDRSALYFKGEAVKGVTRKQAQVLAELLRKPNTVVSHDEMIRQIWGDNYHGATPARINQYISQLNKIFTDLEPASQFIENVRGTGYIFVAPVDSTEQEQVQPTASREKVPAARSRRGLFIAAPVFGLFLLASIAAFWTGVIFTPDDEEEIKDVVHRSQLFEFLELFTDPMSFSEDKLDSYWTRDISPDLNYDRRTIRTLVKKLTDEGRYYGPESRNEKFEFQQVDISSDGAEAVVKTLEKWFIAEYRIADGALIRNRTVGPYFVSYVLRKENGRWLIERSNTARTIRPTPVVESVQIVSDPNYGSRATIIGRDFEPETVTIELTGEQCSGTVPCSIPNSTLRENSKLSFSAIENIPMPMPAGGYDLIVRNGDSTPSKPHRVQIP